MLSSEEKEKESSHLLRESEKFLGCSQGIWPPYYYILYESGQAYSNDPKNVGVGL